MKFYNQKSTLNEVSLDKIENLSAGRSVLLNSIEFKNVKNYYIDFLPFASRKYLEITDEIVEDWNPVEECNFTSERMIKQTARLKDLNWANLNKREKLGVLTPLAFVTLVFGSAVAGEISHFLKSRN